jgi:hypothetical protein
MSAIIPQVLPPPRIEISIRPGTMQDLPFIDRLQKMHTRQVGWMPTRQLEGKINAGHVIVAWAPRPCADEASRALGAPKGQMRSGATIQALPAPLAA